MNTTSTTNNNGSFNNRFLLYIDILGTNHTNEKSLLEIISFFNKSKSNFNIITTPKQNSTEYKIIPEISSFSDHIVISLPEETKIIGDSFMDKRFVLDKLLEYGQFIHQRALESGMLVRGAITLGPLIHEGNVVIGTALNEAVKLEEKTAVYPRVIASSSIMNLLSSELQGFKGAIPLIRDFDGLYYIDYLISIKFYGLESLAVIFQKFRTHIENNLLFFKEDPHRLAKWQWLAYKFDESLGSLSSTHTTWKDSLSQINRFNLTSSYQLETYPRILPWPMRQ